MHLVCEFCAGEFEVERTREKTARFCSRSCAARSRAGPLNSNWKGGKVLQTCEWCGKKFYVKQKTARAGQGRFCSRKCWGLHRSQVFVGEQGCHWQGGEVEKTCEWCGKAFFVAQHRNQTARFCSCGCQNSWRAKAYAGPRSPNWKGGKSFEPYPVTFNGKFKRMIRERDGFACVWCGAKGKCVHHIDYNKKNTVPENCVTLCRSCHGKTNSDRAYWQRELSLIPS